MKHSFTIRFLSSTFVFLKLLLWVAPDNCTKDKEPLNIVTPEVRTHSESRSSLPNQKNTYLHGHQGEQSVAFSEQYIEYRSIQNLDDQQSNSNNESGFLKRLSLLIKNSALLDLSPSTNTLIYPFHFHL